MLGGPFSLEFAEHGTFEVAIIIEPPCQTTKGVGMYAARRKNELAMSPPSVASKRVSPFYVSNDC